MSFSSLINLIGLFQIYWFIYKLKESQTFIKPPKFGKYLVETQLKARVCLKEIATVRHY